jgi:N-succinyldiaminopimelate aminotransferase
MQGFGTTVFAEMTALAIRTGAVNLGQGFPDTDGPPKLLEIAAEAIRGGANQYPPGPGLPELREAVAAQRAERYDLGYDPADEVLVTVGATEGVAATLLALVETGEEVLVFEPYYDSYAAIIALSGGVRRPVTLRPDGGRFTFDPDELRAAVTPRTRAILINSPHNPTGTVFSRAELEIIADVCRERDLIAITDEVYEYLTYDAEHVPIATLPGMRERTVAISSAGKTFSVTGWKTGWIAAPPEFVRAVQTVKQFLTFTSSAPYQRAVAYALGSELAWVAELRASLRAKRDRLTQGLEAAGLTALHAQGTYFVQADVRPLGFTDGREFCTALHERAGIVAIPAQVFYDSDAGDPYVRFAYCKRDEVIDDAAVRLERMAR